MFKPPDKVKKELTQERLLSYLESKKPIAIENITRISSVAFSRDVCALIFEFDICDVGDGFPIYLYLSGKDDVPYDEIGGLPDILLSDGSDVHGFNILGNFDGNLPWDRDNLGRAEWPDTLAPISNKEIGDMILNWFVNIINETKCRFGVARVLIQPYEDDYDAPIVYDPPMAFDLVNNRWSEPLIWKWRHSSNY